jgi:phosphoglucosamine mutase
MMTRSMRADLGVMISASHNHYADNGIKLFGPDGYKLSDAREAEIEAMMDQGLTEGLSPPAELGRVLRLRRRPRRAMWRSSRRPSRGAHLAGLGS